MKCTKCVEDADRALKTNEVWVNLTKHAPITCFLRTTTSVKIKNVNNNRCNVFRNDAGVFKKQEKDEVEIMINKNIIIREKKANKNKKRNPKR